MWDYNNEFLIHQSIGLIHLAFHIVTINGFHLVPRFKLISFQKYWPVSYQGTKLVIHLVIMKPIFMFISGNFLTNFRGSGLRISRGKVNSCLHFFLSLFSWPYINMLKEYDKWLYFSWLYWFFENVLNLILNLCKVLFNKDEHFYSLDISVWCVVIFFLLMPGVQPLGFSSSEDSWEWSLLAVLCWFADTHGSLSKQKANWKF